tara:strand:+ start:378 stop:767 length:390 start_codon:yes stop_codon:yes gene_type:complete
MYRLYLSVALLLLSSQVILAGCGGCSSGRKHSTYTEIPAGLLEKIPANNRLEGNVLVSCGMCNFVTGENDCSLAVKIGSKTLNVRGVKIDDHGDSHAIDGYCNVIKKVYVEGIVRGNYFIPAKMDVEKI